LDLINFRRIYANEHLKNLLYQNNGIEIPGENEKENPSVTISGRHYRQMPNKMLVSCYLNLKNVGYYPESLIEIAYEILLYEFGYFCSEVYSAKYIDFFITPNNMALFLGSTLQTITNIPIIPIDKLGPIPSLQLHSHKLRNILEGKRVNVLVEVISTGSEIDRVIMFLNHMNTSIDEVIGIYDLEAGTAMLVEENRIVSLCKPKGELNYVYRSN
jgi:hypothetical protein